MDITIMDKNLIDVGVIQDAPFDYESSTDGKKCTFQITTLIDEKMVKLADYFYIENTEYGGRVDMQKIDTGKGVIASSGRTWRGILDSKVITPDPGDDYYEITGDLNYIIGQVITKVGLTSLFEADNTETITITYKFGRYVTVYYGIIKMLAEQGYKLSLVWAHGKVVLKALEITDYSDESELTSDHFDFIIQKNTAPVNHMIGLGSGELSQRLVVHKYIQADGSIGDTQHYFGLDEIVDVLDNPNAESLEELELNTIDALSRSSVSDSIDVNTTDDLQADIGDKFTALDVTTGLSVTQYVTDKIVNIDNDVVKVSYEIGDAIK